MGLTYTCNMKISLMNCKKILQLSKDDVKIRGQKTHAHISLDKKHITRAFLHVYARHANEILRMKMRTFPTQKKITIFDTS